MNEAKTIEVVSYEYMSQTGTDQVVSFIIPWITLFAEKVEFSILFFCIIIQCGLIAIANYHNSNYNLICSLLGYRYYQVKTAENTYILLSKKCIRNKNDIKKFVPITDYTGIIKR